MKRLQKRRSRKSRGAGFLEDKDSTKAKRRKSRALEKLASPEFLKELKEKEDFYYLNLGLFKSGKGNRFNRIIIGDPVFNAIRYVRRRAWQTELREQFEAIPKREFLDKEANVLAKVLGQLFVELESTEAYDQEPERLLSHEFLLATKNGNLARLKELLQFCEIHETRAFHSPKESKRDLRPWLAKTSSIGLK